MSRVLQPRADLLQFLESTFHGGDVVPIAGDASTRSFFRVTARGSSWVVMDYGAPFQGDTDDIRLCRIFQEAALPVARIVRAAPEAGCLVLEDLGERTMESALGQIQGSPDALEARERRIRDLYRAAVDLAVALAVRGTPVLARSDRAVGPSLDQERLRFEMDFFLDHHVRGLRALRSTAPTLSVELHHLADAAAGEGPRVFCHRDFHSRNLMVRSDDSLAMVDIQDARWGPDTYDLASLLRDAYADLPEPLVNEMVEAYRRSLPSRPTAEDFRRRFDVVAAQRMIKALGTFAYQTKVMGRTRYLAATPRTLERLAALLPRLPGTRALDRLFREEGLFDVPPDR